MSLASQSTTLYSYRGWLRFGDKAVVVRNEISGSGNEKVSDLEEMVPKRCACGSENNEGSEVDQDAC